MLSPLLLPKSGTIYLPPFKYHVGWHKGVMETMSVKLLKDSELTITNIYIPPQSICPQDFKATTSHLITPQGDKLVLGDLNAHDVLWSSSYSDTRGATLAQEIGDSQMGVLNEDTPTRLPKTGSPTSPDVSLASFALLPTTDWTIKTSLVLIIYPLLFPFTRALLLSGPRNVHSSTSVKLTGTAETELLFSECPTPPDIHTAERKFHSIITRAAGHHLPSGRIPKVQPGFLLLGCGTRRRTRFTQGFRPAVSLDH